MNLDQQCKLIFDEIKAGKISRQEFCDSYDALFTRIPENQRNNIERRMDRIGTVRGRTLGKFALTIYDSTIRELELINSWVAMMRRKKMFDELSIENSGIDNSGLLLLNVHGSKADFIAHTRGGTLMPDGKHNIEIKFSPTIKKLTYKVNNMASYVKKNVYVLTIIANGVVGGNGDPGHSGRIDFDESKLKWIFFPPLLIQRMLDELPHTNRIEMGYKPCIQLLEKDFHKYFSIESW